ncbi:MAG TPA: MFS transporter [Allosphingosinicella sp.]|nr:MFS transporter [Allosphingosinicella sp.]
MAVDAGGVGAGARPPIAHAPPRISTAYRGYVVGLLLAIYIFSSVDRQIIGILAEAIKKELGLADWQIGIMKGLAFSLFYSVLSIPIARLADRYNRAWILSACLVLWSLFTALCALSQNFIQLVLLRVGIAIGEAGCSPAALSLISDYVSKDKRPVALSVYATGLPLGWLIGLATGGLVAQYWGWRAALLAAGVPGVILGFVTLLTLREVRERAGRVPLAAEGATFGETLRQLKSRPSFWLATFAAGGNTFVLAAFQTFAAPFFLRNHSDGIAAIAARLEPIVGMRLEPIGLLGIGLGLATGLSGAAGMLLGGVASARAARKDERDVLTVSAFAVLLSVPLWLAALLTGNPALALILWATASALLVLPVGTIYSVVQSVAPLQSRAMAAAISLLIMNLIGGGFGPLFAGVVSDLLNRAGLGPALGLRYALIGTSLLVLVTAWLFWRTRRYLVADSAGDRVEAG